MCNDRTRTDIAFSIGELTKCFSKPHRNHVVPANRVIRYLKLTRDYHLRYSRGRPGESLEIYGYCDASCGCQDDGKAVSGHFLQITCSSQKQSGTAISTASAELNKLLSHLLCKNQTGLRICSEILVSATYSYDYLRGSSIMQCYCQERHDQVKDQAKTDSISFLSCSRSSTGLVLYRTHAC